jgi:hypothetical protein
VTGAYTRHFPHFKYLFVSRLSADLALFWLGRKLGSGQRRNDQGWLRRPCLWRLRSRRPGNARWHDAALKIIEKDREQSSSVGAQMAACVRSPG